jgi:hypothetical protein
LDLGLRKETHDLGFLITAEVAEADDTRLVGALPVVGCESEGGLPEGPELPDEDAELVAVWLNLAVVLSELKTPDAEGARVVRRLNVVRPGQLRLGHGGLKKGRRHSAVLMVLCL